MNMFAGYPRPLPCGRYWAMVRFAKDGNPKPIMAPGGTPEIYYTELEAQRAVTKHLLAYMNGPEYLRTGEKLPTAVSEAEKQWGAIFVKGREIKIERKAVKT